MSKRVVNDRNGKEPSEKPVDGIGMKLLLQMGYKPGSGLGKFGEGIVDPIQVQLRPKNTGLGFAKDDEIEDAQRKDEWNGEKTALHKGTGNKAFSSPLLGKRVVDAAGRNEHYEYDYSLSKSHRGGTRLETKIIDMRGIESKTFASYTDLYTAQNETKPSLPKHFVELQHNLGIVLGQIHRQLADAKRCMADERLAEQQLRGNLEVLTKEHEEISQRQSQTEALLQFATTSKNLLMGPLNIESMLQLRDLYRQGKSKFQFAGTVERMEKILSSLLISHLRMEMGTALDLLASKKCLFDIFATLYSFLSESDEQYDESTSLYEQIFRACWVPPVRARIVNESMEDLYTNWQEITALFLQWRPLIPNKTFAYLESSLIMPKLHRLIASVNEVELLAPMIKSWILALCSQEFKEELYPIVRRRLAQLLGHWEPSDPTGLRIANQWQPPMLSEAEYDLFVGRVIVPKLKKCLSQDLIIDPANQDTKVLEWVLPWAPPTISNLWFTKILVDALFPKLRQMLGEWLKSPLVDLEEVTDWYLGWKEIFPPSISNDPIIAEQFNLLLDMMNQIG